MPNEFIPHTFRRTFRKEWVIVLAVGLREALYVSYVMRGMGKLQLQEATVKCKYYESSE